MAQAYLDYGYATGDKSSYDQHVAYASQIGFCNQGGRFGSHNVHENQPVPTAWVSGNVIVRPYFNAGVRTHDIRDHFRPQGVAYYVPPVPKGCTGINVNAVYVDENALIIRRCPHQGRTMDPLRCHYKPELPAPLLQVRFGSS